MKKVTKKQFMWGVASIGMSIECGVHYIVDGYCRGR